MHDAMVTSASRLTRRQFLRASLAAAAAAATATALRPALPAQAAPRLLAVAPQAETAATRAIAGIKALNLPSDFTLTVFSEDLSILGPEVTKAKFEEESGIKLDIQKAPFLEYFTKIAADAANKAGTYDVVLVEINRTADLDGAGYITPLDDWVNKYGPALDTMIPPLNSVWPKYNGRYVGLPTDGDTWIFYYRKDWLEDPQNQADFKAKYGRDLTLPTTWDEYNQLLEFFTRPDQNMYGAVEWRVKGVTYWWFWQRLVSAGGTFFDDNMKAAINSPEGVKGLEDLKATNAYMPRDVLSHGYIEGVAAMQQGTTFSNITWPAAGKNINDPATSKTVGKWGYTTVPGYVVNGKPNPKTMSAPGYNCVVSAYSRKNKEAAYLYSQWYTSPENLKLANMNLKGNTDVIHQPLFEDPDLQNLFPGAAEYLKAQLANLAQAIPDPVIPGYTEYTQALEIEISNFMTGSKSAKQALDDAAAAWDRITEEQGAERQKEIYQNFLKAYQGG